MSNVQVRKGTEKPRRFTNNPTEKIRVVPYCRVSTDSDDQLESYKTQVAYYTDLVNSNPEWEMVGIYADESITGTQTKKRDDFNRMIDDCMSGKIDLVIEGGVLLTILSSVAQQKVENISANVKFGLRARMKDGKMLAFANAWGIITTQKHKCSP